MSKSSHQVQIKGVDQTGAAFDSVKARAKATGASIRAALGGALAAAGAYLGVRALGNSIKELGKLSDLAMKAGTSVEFLTKATTAFQVAGLNVTVESLTKAMQFLQKNTGKKGEDAFFSITKEIAAIPDAAERAQAAVKVFGRAGMELLPMVDNGQLAIEKFQALANVMPGVSSAAADAGDAAADALTILGNGAKDLMLKVVGGICKLWGDDFPGGIRAGALSAVNYLEIFAKRTQATFQMVKEEISASVQFWKTAWELGWSTAVAEHELNSKKITEAFTKRMLELDNEREAYVKSLESLDVGDLANAFSPQKRTEMQLAGESFGAAAAKRITNALITGGSNEANRLAILGPQYQNEAKKQTSLLEKIAKNTEKTADNTEGGDEIPAANLGT